MDTDQPLRARRRMSLMQIGLTPNELQILLLCFEAGIRCEDPEWVKMRRERFGGADERLYDRLAKLYDETL